jgi:hypothetical protein
MRLAKYKDICSELRLSNNVRRLFTSQFELPLSIRSGCELLTADGDQPQKPDI